MKRVAWLQLILVLQVGRAPAGQVIHGRIIDHTGPRPLQCRLQAYLEGNRVKIAIPPPGGRPDSVLFTPDRQVIRHLDHGTRSYQEFDTRVVGGAGEVARSVRDFVEDAWAEISGKPGVGRDACEIRKTQEVQTVSGLPCRKFIVLKGGARIQEIWATSWTRAGLASAQATSLRQLALYYANLASALQGVPFFDELSQFPLTALVRLNAYPVVIRQYRGKRLATVLSLSRPSDMRLEPGTFALPDGYTKRRLWQKGK